MNIGTATINDIPELQRLINKAYRGDASRNGWTSEEGILEGERIGQETLEGDLGPDHTNILKYTDVNGAILGTVYTEFKTPVLYPGMLAVMPGQQARGMGKSIMQEAENLAKKHDCDRIAIPVISSRLELISWHERRGYRMNGESINFDELKGNFGILLIQDIQLIGMEKSLA